MRIIIKRPKIAIHHPKLLPPEIACKPEAPPDPPHPVPARLHRPGVRLPLLPDHAHLPAPRRWRSGPGSDEVVDRRRQADPARARPGVRREADDRQRGDRPRPFHDPADDRLAAREERERLYRRVARVSAAASFRAASGRRGAFAMEVAGRSLRP